jgi:hypothetical protein
MQLHAWFRSSYKVARELEGTVTRQGHGGMK